MKPKTKTELRALGFKPVQQHPEIWINANGSVFSFAKKGYLKPNSRNLIALDQGRYLNIPKAILQEFTGQKIRELASVVYIDGCKTNLSPLNLKYKRLFEGNPPKVNQTNLINAIRCFYTIESDFKAPSLLSRIYLSEMLNKTPEFITANCKKNRFQVFQFYILHPENSIVATAKAYSIEIKDCTHIVNTLINEFTAYILSQLDSGLLTQYPFCEMDRKQKNRRNALASWNQHTRSIQKGKNMAQ